MLETWEIVGLAIASILFLFLIALTIKTYIVKRRSGPQDHYYVDRKQKGMKDKERNGPRG